ncbi:FAD-binding oxidoreductase [Allorhizocola rhizosphaerae]|uniref:FAD-binding oxidoreductase n=1 Tax=Allorhizocola rhizosphaerae TaxID=1872709 RepID=UPI000E3B8852|nr:FAD-binding protein [Allorhizocola rhizosphaerae]
MEARPTSTAEAASILREAAAKGWAVVVRGAGTKQSWGRPPRRCDLVLDTTGLTGVVEHAAGDLIAVVRAGTPLAELQSTLGFAGQQLALDSPFPNATVGGTVAVNTSGPRRMTYGTVRDLIIGVTIVRPDGVIARAGGKVVKNVAGYDLAKLMTGSHGTLGLIAECAFRLHPRVETSFVRKRGDFGTKAGLAWEIDAPADGDWKVAWEMPGAGGDPKPEWWGRYPWREGELGVKLTAALSKVRGLLAAAKRLGVSVRGSLGTGVLYAAAQPDQIGDLRAAAHEAGGHAVVLTYHEGVDLWGPVPGLDLMRRVKAQFDPDDRFAPGRFVV